MRLNCITKQYEELWNEFFEMIPKNDLFSKPNIDSKTMLNIDTWNNNTPLRMPIERRQALLEIDVIVAMELGMSLSDLISIYKIQFPVLSSNESKILFDRNGRELTTEIRNEYLKDVENNITKHEYGGYFTPFIKCNRVEDYKTAWAHFEKIFNKNTN